MTPRGTWEPHGHDGGAVAAARKQLSPRPAGMLCLFNMLAEDSRELLGPPTVTTSQISRAVIQEPYAFTGQALLSFF